jgi:hypothetical protein
VPAAVAHLNECDVCSVRHCAYGEDVNVNANDDDGVYASDYRRCYPCWIGAGPERVKAPGPFLGSG